MKTTKWDIYEELKTEEEIQAFVEASIIEAENDKDPRSLSAFVLSDEKKCEKTPFLSIFNSANSVRSPKIRDFSGF
ncbi:MAG: hypothetical protein FWH41_00700 [Treponema sp.]|nr:hypothetical protein [Treponema sp.]